MADAPAPIPAVLDDDHRDPRDWMAGESGMAWMAIVERDYWWLIGREQRVQAVPKAGLLCGRSAEWAVRLDGLG